MQISPLLGDALTETFYWPHLFGGCILWALMFGSFGLLVARLLLHRSRARVARIEIENERLRREQRELRNLIDGDRR